MAGIPPDGESRVFCCPGFVLRTTPWQARKFDNGGCGKALKIPVRKYPQIKLALGSSVYMTESFLDGLASARASG